MNFTPEQIARVTHETNRTYCQLLGDTSQVPWDLAPEWQRNSAIAGVRAILEEKVQSPVASHESWLAQKRAEGWVDGPTKDIEKKIHPCCVPWDQLPIVQRFKDVLFFDIVRSFLDYDIVERP